MPNSQQRFDANATSTSLAIVPKCHLEADIPWQIPQCMCFTEQLVSPNAAGSAFSAYHIHYYSFPLYAIGFT